MRWYTDACAIEILVDLLNGSVLSKRFSVSYTLNGHTLQRWQILIRKINTTYFEPRVCVSVRTRLRHASVGARMGLCGGGTEATMDLRWSYVGASKDG